MPYIHHHHWLNNRTWTYTYGNYCYAIIIDLYDWKIVLEYTYLPNEFATILYASLVWSLTLQSPVANIRPTSINNQEISVLCLLVSYYSHYKQRLFLKQY
jgi:hypothetical protein